jgi:hypothetical protein
MPRYLIQTPVANASTDLGDVHFHQGKAELDEVPYWLSQYCESNGYSITDTQAVDEGQADGVPDDDNNPATPPPGNATTEAWREHVLAIGKGRLTDDQVAALGTATRDQLKEMAVQLGQEGPKA